VTDEPCMPTAGKHFAIWSYRVEYAIFFLPLGPEGGAGPVEVVLTRSGVRYQLLRSKRSGNGSWEMALWKG
jgi:hypothetical protein